MSEKLIEYKKKRDFAATTEPDGGEFGKSGATPQKQKERVFVVQHHMARAEHYDLRLELHGVLLSWAVPKGPSYNTADKRLAVHVEDHPLEYKDFEGTIPKGEYGGGTVMIWDEGTWEPQFDPVKGYKDGSLKIILHGKRLKGKWALVRMKKRSEKDGDNWLLIKEKDEYVKKSAGISGFRRSVRTNRTMAEITRGDNPAKSEIKDAKNRIRRKNDKTRRNPFSRAELQLAEAAAEIPTGGGWLYELKYDGFRMMAYAEDGNVRLLSRNGKDYTDRFDEVASELKELSKDRAMVLDGEIIVTDEKGRPDFQALQNSLKHRSRDASPVYMAFDLLALDGRDIRGEPLKKRKKELRELLKKSDEFVRYSGYTEKISEKQLENLCNAEYEGLIGKRADSVYSGKRSGDWIKLKCGERQEFVIGGFTRSDKKHDGISSLLLGYYSDGALVYAGRVGTGFGEKTGKELYKTLSDLARKTSPFSSAPPSKHGEKVFYVRPSLAAEVEFAEWTHEGLVRQASFKGLRSDKDVREIVLEKKKITRTATKNAETPTKTVKNPQITTKTTKNAETPTKAAKNPQITTKTTKNAEKPTKATKNPQKTTKTTKNAEKPTKAAKNPQITTKTTKNAETPTKAAKNPQKPTKSNKSAADKERPKVGGVGISSPEKLLFKNPPVTKLDVAEYYDLASKRMMPYVKNRILSLVCCPSGIGKACYFRKHPAEKDGEISKIVMPDKEGEYFFITKKAGLVSLVQYNAIEFHTWGSTTDDVDSPDIMVFDLDPDEGLDIKKLRRGVLDLKKILECLSLTSFLKTSGGKGYHVVVPFRCCTDWEYFREFSRGIAELMEQKWPDRYTSNIRKEKRKGRIFIDWIRNGRGATSVAPYSLRARDGASLSMPLEWNELNKYAPDFFTIENAAKRLALPDPWKDFFKVKAKQSLK